jgi:cold shock CspA family protein
MRYGTIVQYFPAKRFGFIRPDVGPDIFFHATALGGCEPAPKIVTGQPVKYELVPGTEPKRRRVRPDDDEPPAEPARPQAQLVELIDKMPGARLEGSSGKTPRTPHPRARRKKPTWRR